MTDEQQRESPGSGTSRQTAPAEAPAIFQSLVFPRYVVAEVYRRIENKLGLQGLRNDEDIAWVVQRRLPVTAINALTLHGISLIADQGVQSVAD